MRGKLSILLVGWLVGVLMIGDGGGGDILVKVTMLVSWLRKRIVGHRVAVNTVLWNGTNWAT